MNAYYFNDDILWDHDGQKSLDYWIKNYKFSLAEQHRQFKRLRAKQHIHVALFSAIWGWPSKSEPVERFIPLQKIELEGGQHG